MRLGVLRANGFCSLFFGCKGERLSSGSCIASAGAHQASNEGDVSSLERKSARVGVTFQEAVYSVRIGTTGYRAIAADVFIDNWFA